MRKEISPVRLNIYLPDRDRRIGCRNFFYLEKPGRHNYIEYQ